MSTMEEVASAAAEWLARHAPAHEPPGPPPLTPFEPMSAEAERELVERGRRWQAHKAAHGWGAPSLPAKYGGRGGGRAADVAFWDAESRYHLPTHLFEVTTRMVLPTLVHWAPEKVEDITRLVRGEDLWCQLFSEPGCGSDLAAIRTRAVRRDDGSWVVDGQKVWTSWAHLADRGYLLARTGDGGGHAGLTAFVIDMSAPGVEVRPIVQATGAVTFNEVFLDGAVLPPEAAIGPPGAGWSVALTTLMNERLAVGPDQIPFAALRDEASARGSLADPDVAAALGAVRARRRIVEQLRHGMLRAVSEGADPGPEGSVAKLCLADGVRAAAETARAILGGDLATESPLSRFALSWPGIKNAGGTDEIQKSIVADRVLGLPRERDRREEDHRARQRG
ncbi:acyl-CoA dehydrogenase family protein [Actinomadura madurae]|uniref:acyl-CoA dehydrogenase family protein n=1 Tax=Actinomadura madurae TaxID=1993 RepID=UPI0020D22EB1|nr:acyl-CoA dehydrogenase family protein [Actinomadura madurae]MCP9951930.1 acyl-CoA dehydrogenase family protein [Actinomadura madurae]MCQ0007333.1 acyl-CoA dehydrogenase family protein [Actinomadura madurae]MCQ0017364.1 acyl-CoA dehydrogenase family protein [Actinomadura madurae]